MNKKIRLELTQLEFARLYQESETLPTLHKILDKKIDDMIRRELYQDYINAKTDAEKEKARQIYLNKITGSI
jgi:hypothetical protein